jgi:hypothetical protein
MASSTPHTQDQVRRIVDFYEEDYAARRVLDFLREEKEPPKWNYVSIKQTSKESGKDYRICLEVFKRLEKIKIGGVTPGRHGNVTRFIWFVAFLPLMEAVNQEVLRRESESEQTTEKGKIPGTLGETIEHPYVLRRDFPVRFTLPANFTTKEAERLASWIKTLPFD